MFPANVRSRLYEEQDDNANRRKQHGNLKSYLRDGNSIVLSGAHESDMNAKPLADLFTETTVLVRVQNIIVYKAKPINQQLNL